MSSVPASLHMRCPSCTTAYRVALSIIPEAGAKAQCKVCDGVLVLRLPPKPRVWVFTDDPAMQRGTTLDQIRRAPGYEFLLLDSLERQVLSELPTFPMPDAVIFGDMHVLLEDSILSRCSGAGIVRILLSTHRNDDLQAAAKSFCGFDHNLQLPVEPALLGSVLEGAAATL